MRIFNRMAVTMTGLEPYLEWMRQRDADFNPGPVTVARTRTYGASFLLPEFEMEEDVLEWIEENYAWLFEFQLSAWTEDETAWPAPRDLPMFKRWFKVDIQNIVVDMGDDEIVATEL
jgi:hypothetical protein